MKNAAPKKPKSQKGQIDMIWNALFNEIPCQFRWQNIKLNFILAFMGLVLALLGVVVLQLS